MKKKSAFLMFLALVLCPCLVYGEENALTGSGLALPRFASLRSDKVNMRTGPGTRYPIEWVLRHEGMPVEITAEFDVWRRVRDWEGTEGWIHQRTLSGRRFVIITSDQPVQIRKQNDITSPVLAIVDPGVVGKLLSCDINWCKVHFDNVQGYLEKSSFWGAYSGEKLK